MCIRDRLSRIQNLQTIEIQDREHQPVFEYKAWPPGQHPDCLLYTSDAADERSSVDLGGRRIIKKKKRQRSKNTRATNITTKQQ